ncbi:FISUMP domain-containing protein [Fibrobacter sp. UWB10]|uniref:FISUMP domain-containing protein n=1 Tax=Fibrobacter sp. UWB10 TaxID=1896201 RepID=UPI00240334C1|nr:FISUMP domain-containing protein [Fibrobacter sp. UWB10]SMP48809.1 major paralogous domain-containing protein [Fibrobacter sp. UWB10]
MKIFANALALSILLALLAACGDESSSSVSPEPRQCEEQSDDCDDASSSSEKISKNSSSSQKSADKGKSSSSEKNVKESSSSTTTKNSSSSVSGDKSSSSVKKEESSSSAVKSSSSVTPKSSSSEEVKQSSSSVVASSSSVTSSETVKSSSSKQNPWGTEEEWWPFSCNAFGGCLEFTDKRNNRTYKYLKFEGKDTTGEAATIYAMVENLNVGEMVRGYKDQKDDSKIERYCYDNDTLNCLYYGGLYQWAEMMQLPFECNSKSCADSIKPNHQGVCPEGWRLLTYNDFYIIVNSNGNTHGVEGVRSSFGFGGYNTTGYSLVGAGYNWDYSFERLNESTYWHYPQEGSIGNNTSFVGYQGRTSTKIGTQSTYKTHGFSVRCVMVE